MPKAHFLILPLALALLGCGGSNSPPPETNREAAATPKETPATSTEHAAHPQDTGPAKPAAGTWTLDVKAMRFPEGPASGKVAGQPFKADTAELDSGTLILRQGKDAFDGLEVRIFLSFEKQSLAGKTYEVTPEQKGLGVPTVTLNGKGTESMKEPPFFQEKYALRLELGQDKDGRLPGKVYLCLPDAGKSYVAGTFSAEVEPDYTKAPQKADAPFVTGKIELKGRPRYTLLAGITGLTKDGKPLTNAAGTEVTPKDGTWVTSKTFKPQVTTLVNDATAGCSYHHIKLPPGRYLVYARFGDRFLDGRWVELEKEGKESELTVNLTIDPDTAGSLEVTLPKGAKEGVQLIPLDEAGKLPDLKTARSWVAANLKTDVPAKDGKVLLDGLRPGAYRVSAGGAEKDVTVKAKETAKLDLSAP
jgi:hypothetical protein